jgi:uncharacterized protein
MRHRSALAAGLAALVLLGLTGGATAGGGKRGPWADDTEAVFTPFQEFTPAAGSAPCPGEPTDYEAQPFVIPAGYEQRVVLEEGTPPPWGGSSPTQDLWDMNTQNETGKDAGRYVYRTHETGSNGAVTVTDLKTGVTSVLAQRADFERFDGVVWTPWKTLLAAEETITASQKDPTVPQAVGGLVYEFFLDPKDPSKLSPKREPIDPNDGTTDSVQDGIRARPAVGARSHEGLRFDHQGNLYGIAESSGASSSPEPNGRSGAIFKFTPDSWGNPLASGQLYALQTDNRHDGTGRWVPLDRTQSQIESDTEAERKQANEYQRPEDVETDTSTGRDFNNDGETLYVAITGTDEVLAIDLGDGDAPFAYHYVYDGSEAHTTSTGTSNVAPDFDSPDNVALDAQGNLMITEDPGGGPLTKSGDDVWVAAPPRDDEDDDEVGANREQASTVQRFATLKDCDAEPSGIYFPMKNTEKYVKSWNRDLAEFLTGESLLIHRMHSGQTGPQDQLIVISPVDSDDDDDDDDEDKDE